MAKRGPKPLQVDWAIVDKLGGLHCTGEEIAGFLGIGYNTLERRCKSDKKCKLGDYLSQKASNGSISLRRKQHEIAMSGNATMLIWLGKNYLNQKDKTETEITGGITVQIASDEMDL